MTLRYIINLSLILLIAGLYWLSTSNTATDDGSVSPLTAIATNTISNITISRSTGPDISLQKATSGWQLTTPFNAPANSKRIDLLLSLLTAHSYAQSSGQTQNLAQFGLMPAKISLKLNDVLFQFGDIESVSGHRYILHNGIIHLISDEVMPLLRANAASFIENRLFANKKHISKIILPLRATNVTFADNTIVTIENNKGKWQSNLAILTADKLTTLIDSWQRSYALQVMPINAKTQYSTDLYRSVTLWFEDGSKAELIVSLSDNALYIINLKQQLKYQFTANKAEQLFPLDTTVTP